MNFKNLAKKDSQIAKLIKAEIERQETTIDLIASENIASKEVLEALGSPLVNKYSEGYPGKRYYSGVKFYDEIERLCQKRALELFNLSDLEWGANVQPLSGTPANLAIYGALIGQGEKILGMSLAAGGHLSHGTKISFSGKFWQGVFYGVNKDGFLDYQEIEKIALAERPKIIIAGATAYSREIDFKKFSDIAKKVGAYLVADISHVAGLIAADLHPSPFYFADVVMATTHKTLCGPRGAVIFAKKDLIDKINKAVFPGVQGGPHNNITAAKAVAFKLAKSTQFKKYQKQVIKNAKVLAEELKKCGFNILTGGTDNHLMILDLKNMGIGGKEAEEILEKGGILVNREMLPDDQKALNPSGIRLGTPYITSRGMKEGQMREVANWIKRILKDKENSEKIKKEAKNLMKKFPLGY
ncbi:MAG: Serine hydroxymethyltransferase [Parcubacteria group bacterium GW2011_GWA2_39_18]|nr:MAG: Serine hydroxymethyltransferase [Parcubacteria group bacterium GW2011_GWA2_39_18]